MGSLLFCSHCLVLGSPGYPLPNSPLNSIFYLKVQLLRILSLVTLAQMLEALTTLWSLSAFGCTITPLIICEYQLRFLLRQSAYLDGSPTVSAYICAILKPSLRAPLASSKAEEWLIQLRLVCCFLLFMQTDMYQAVSSLVEQNTNLPFNISIMSKS